jgi:hypothetical protein
MLKERDLRQAQSANFMKAGDRGKEDFASTIDWELVMEE